MIEGGYRENAAPEPKAPPKRWYLVGDKDNRSGLEGIFAIYSAILLFAIVATFILNGTDKADIWHYIGRATIVDGIIGAIWCALFLRRGVPPKDES